MRHALAGARPAVAVQQTVTSRNIDTPTWGGFKPLDAASMQCGDNEAEAGNGHGKGVEVHPGNSIKSTLGQYTRVGARLALGPEVEQASKGTQQEMPGAAGRVDQAHVLQAELVQSRGQRVIQDEFLDKHRSLQQGVLLTRLLRQ